MSLVFERSAVQSDEERRIRVEARVVMPGISADDARLAIERIVSGAGQAAGDAPLQIDAEYDANSSSLAVTLLGGFSAMRLLERTADEDLPLFDPQAACRLVMRLDSVRYELMVALGDHLLNAAKNHPQGSGTLQLQTHYDEDEEQLEIVVDGSLFAAGYLLLLVWLQATQSRFR